MQEASKYKRAAENGTAQVKENIVLFDPDERGNLDITEIKVCVCKVELCCVHTTIVRIVRETGLRRAKAGGSGLWWDMSKVQVSGRVGRWRVGAEKLVHPCRRVVTHAQHG